MPYIAVGGSIVRISVLLTSKWYHRSVLVELRPLSAINVEATLPIVKSPCAAPTSSIGVLVYTSFCDSASRTVLESILIT